MSTLFNASDNDEGVVSPADNQEIESYASLLVGDGKPFKDQEALAKAKYHSDKTIKAREAELAALRKELNSRLELEKLIDKLETSSRTKGSVSNDGNTNDRSEQLNEETALNKSTLTMEQVMDAVQKTMNQEKLKSQRDQNIDTCVSKLKEVWGAGYSAELSAKAEELGVSKEQLTELAANSPKVFLSSVLGGDAKRLSDASSSLAPKSTVNPSASANGSVYTKGYFSKMRKEDPTQYWSPKIQNLILQLAEQGKLSL